MNPVGVPPRPATGFPAGLALVDMLRMSPHFIAREEDRDA